MASLAGSLTPKTFPYLPSSQAENRDKYLCTYRRIESSVRLRVLLQLVTPVEDSPQNNLEGY
jgi:hypothetical protein